MWFEKLGQLISISTVNTLDFCPIRLFPSFLLVIPPLLPPKIIVQGKLFQRCTHLLYCSILPMGGNVNKRRMSKPDMGSIFHIKHQWNILAVGNCYVNYQNYQNLMLLTSSDTKRTVMHLFLFTNSAQRELVSICTRVYATAINFPCITTLVEMQSCNFK